MSGGAYLEPATGSRIDLGRDPIVIGRGADADLVCDAVSVSRRHAEVIAHPHGHRLVDLGSTNGTFVNGTRVEAEVELRDGDEIVVGGAMAIRYRDPRATPMAPAIGKLFGTWIDPDTGAVWVDAMRVDLSPRQLALIELLYRHEGEVVSRFDVLDAVWPEAANEGVSAEAVDALVKRTRGRIREAGAAGDYLETVRGLGFRLNPSTR